MSLDLSCLRCSHFLLCFVTAVAAVAAVAAFAVIDMLNLVEVSFIFSRILSCCCCRQLAIAFSSRGFVVS